ncbi:MAG: CAP domain-containing protein, partial [Ardenticatenales bacterium]
SGAPNAPSAVIARNVVSGTERALIVDGAAGVSHNTVVDNRFGILVGPESAVVVVDNLIASNGGTGLSIYDSGAGDPPTAWRNGAAHHNLIADNLTDYGDGLAPGDGDVNEPPFLLEPTIGNLSLGAGSPARGAASDGGDIGALPFTPDGVAPTDLAVGLSPDATADAPRWRATWTAAPGATRYHLWVSGAQDGQSWDWRLEVPLSFNWSDLAELEIGHRYRVALSSVTADGESELSPEVAFVAVPPALEIEDDAASLTVEGDWRSVTAAEASAGHYIVATDVDAALSFGFAGDSVSVRRIVGPSGGRARVWVDDTDEGTLEFHFVERRFDVPSVYDGFGDGPHVLRMIVLKDADGASKGHEVAFDRAIAPSGVVRDDIQREALTHMNAIRAAAGLPTVRAAGALDLATMAHAAYDQDNGRGEGHNETAGVAGFTGVRPWERAAYFGYTPTIGEDMTFRWGVRENAAGFGYGAYAIDSWQQTVYHRNLIMGYGPRAMGFGYAFRADRSTGVLHVGSRTGMDRHPEARTIYTWPIDGADDVPASWDGNEGPDPLPQRDDAVGYPISLYIAMPAEAAGSSASAAASASASASAARGPRGATSSPDGSWSPTSHEPSRPADPLGALLALSLIAPLRTQQASPWKVTIAELHDARGAIVKAYELEQKNDPPRFLGPDVVFLIPEQPTAQNARFEAHVAGIDSRGAAFDARWSFTTRGLSGIDEVKGDIGPCGGSIAWTTTGLATGRVRLGADAGRYDMTLDAPVAGTQHTVHLPGPLTPGDVLHYVVESTDASGGHASTDDRAFTIHPARTIHVPGDVATLAAALDGAHGCDIVEAAAGTYAEAIHVPAGVTLTGAGATVTTIRGPGSGNVVELGDGSVLEGFTVTGGGQAYWDAGVFVGDGVGATVRHNRLTGNGVGFAAYCFGDGCTNRPLVMNNVVYGNAVQGIAAHGIPLVALNNTVWGGKRGIAVDVAGAVIRGNIVGENEWAGVGGAEGQDVAYNNVWHAATAYDKAAPGDGALALDPAFVDAANSDFHLTSASPCVDAGDPADARRDGDGSRGDMGAYGGP